MIARALRIVVLLELLLAASVAHALFWWADWPFAAAAATGLGIPLFIHATIVAIPFAISRHARGPAPVGFGLGPAAALALYAREFLDAFVVYQVAQPWLAGHPLAGEDRRQWLDGDPLPVLLVHGYVCNRQVWRTAARRLAARGHAIGAVDLEPVWGSIDDYAAPIGRAASALLARTGAPRIALLCHSMGGLAARAWLRSGGESALALTAAVVTLGTPHRGTFHAVLGQGLNARQMRIGSEWLDDLAQAETDATHERFTVILSHHDNIVASRERQTLPGAATIELGGIGHLSLARAERVIDTAADAIERATARSGSPSSAAGTRSGQP